MSPEIIAALIGSLTTLLATYGAKLASFGAKKTVLHLHGSATILKRLTGGELNGYEGAQENRDYPQKISDCLLTLTEVTARLDARIDIDDLNGRVVCGQLTGQGVFEKGTALLQYQVTQKGGQRWAGVMSLSISGMGPVLGYFLTNSFSHPGHVNLGRIALGPSSDLPPQVNTRQLTEVSNAALLSGGQAPRESP